jgi:hypothetical protein
MQSHFDADLEVVRDARIVTGRYQQFQPSQGVPVRTTVGAPRFWRHGPLLHAKAITPWYEFRLDEAEAEAKYKERLDREAHRVIRQLAALVTEAGDQTLVLLCYDDLDAGAYCHRRWFADWLWDRYGIEVPELHNTGDDPWSQLDC